MCDNCKKRVRTRVAPSPTGDPHVGTAYIALFNIAFAHVNDGDFILRIEDTDRNRYTAGSEQMIFDALKWLDLDYSEGPDVGGDYGPYRQSERFDLYGKYAKELVEKGGAYYCFCDHERLENLRERQKAMGLPPGYDGHCRSLSKEEIEEKLKAGVPYVIRLKMPYEGETVIHDRLRGDVVFENSKIDDQVLLKADGYPTYHLANIVDDHLMGITHVIRAEEWIPSTPKHIQLYKAFGWKAPEFIHMPLLRNDDRSKISKRKNPVSLIWYKEEGYLKEGLVNFLGLMGYSYGDGQEIFTLQEFKDNFNIDKVTLGGPVFDLVKLGWVNNQHMKMKDLDKGLKALDKISDEDITEIILKKLGYNSEDELDFMEKPGNENEKIRVLNIVYNELVNQVEIALKNTTSEIVIEKNMPGILKKVNGEWGLSDELK